MPARVATSCSRATSASWSPLRLKQVAFTQDDRAYVVDRANKLVRVGSGDRFFGAVVSPDGDKVVFQGLTTGLHLYVRSTGTLRHIGPGTAPAWSPDSTRLVYEVTEDDGHEIVASDLYIYEVASDRVAALTTTDRVVERRPSFSPDGSQPRVRRRHRRHLRRSPGGAVMKRALLIALFVVLPSIAHAQMKIVIDPGHGGEDPGGVGTGMQEKNVVLDVSKRFKALLDADTADNAGGGKWTSLMTRSTDVFVSLAGRVRVLEQPGRGSLHVDPLQRVRQHDRQRYRDVRASPRAAPARGCATSCRPR